MFGCTAPYKIFQAAWQVSGRGRMLLNMIQLDTVNMDLLTLSPATYETYIASFGHSNRRQVRVMIEGTFRINLPAPYIQESPSLLLLFELCGCGISFGCSTISSTFVH